MTQPKELHPWCSICERPITAEEGKEWSAREDLLICYHLDCIQGRWISVVEEAAGLRVLVEPGPSTPKTNPRAVEELRDYLKGFADFWDLSEAELRETVREAMRAKENTP